MTPSGTCAPGMDRALRVRHRHHVGHAAMVAFSLLSVLALPSCGSPADPGAAAARRISGTAVPWIGEAAFVSAVDFAGDAMISGPISAAGAFSLLLPDPLAAEWLDAVVPCSGVAVVPSDVRGGFMEFLVVTDGEGHELGILANTNMADSLQHAEVGDAFTFRLYLDRAAAIHGTCVEDAGYEVTEIVYVLDLSRGWNVVTTRLTEATEGARTLEVRGGDPPAGVAWRFVERVGPGPDPQDPEYSLVPVEVFGDHAFVAVGAGNWHTCGVTDAGVTLCWGVNEFGQLGAVTETCETTIGPMPCARAPVPVAGAPRLARVDASSNHSCGLDAQGRAYCWGFGVGGQLGDGRSESSTEPVAVAGGHTFTSLVTDPWCSETCGLLADGTAWCWGAGNYTWLMGSDVPVVLPDWIALADLSMGQLHACGLTAAGGAYCWGSNWYGQLGTGLAKDDLPTSAVPVAVTGGHVFTRIAVGVDDSCALDAVGAVWCWGTEHGPTPVVLAPGGHPPFVSLVAGPSHACGLTQEGSAWCWGINWGGALGDGSQAESAVPVVVAGGLLFERLAAGGGHTCGITTAGRLLCWGSDGFGQLGRGNPNPGPAPLGFGLGSTRQ